MAVPEQTPYKEYTGNGVTKSFPLEFACEEKAHLIVTVNDIEPEFSAWSFTDGAVVFTIAPPADAKIIIQRNTPFSRTTDYQSYNNSFRPPAVNGDFDRVWYKIQELGVKDWLLDLKIQKFRDDVNLTALENTLEEAKQIRDETANSVIEVRNNVSQSQTLLADTTAQANLAQGYTEGALAAKEEAELIAADAQNNVDAAQAAVGSTKNYVDTALSAFSGPATKFFLTVTAANAAIATIGTGEAVWIGDAANGGLWVKETAGATSLTKSPYDPLLQGKIYTDSANIKSQQAASVEYIQPNLIPDNINNIQTTAGVVVGASVSLSLSTYNNTPCFKGTNPIGNVNNCFEYKIPVSEFNGSSVISASVLILAADASGSGSGQGRVLIRQFSGAGATEITAARSVFVYSNNGAALTTPTKVKFDGVALDPSATYVSIFIDCQATASATAARNVYFREILLAAGTNSDWRANKPNPLELSYLPDNTFANAVSGGTGTGSFSTAGGELTITPTTNNPSYMYLVNTTAALSAGRSVQAIVDAMTDKVGGAQLDLMFFNAGGTEISRISVSNKVANSYETLRAVGVIPSGTTQIRLRVVCWYLTAPNSTYAKFRIPALVNNQNLLQSNVRTFSLGIPMLGVGHLNTYVSATGSDSSGDGSIANPFATPDKALSVMSGIGDLIIMAGEYGALQLDAAKMKDVNIVGLSNSLLQRPVFKFGTKLTGISLVSGKVYKATITLSGQPNFIWQDGVNDASTLVSIDEQHFGLKGRSHRLQSTRIVKTTATTRSTAITEIESASDPRCFYDSALGEILFSVASGTDAVTADIRLPSTTQSLFKNLNGSIWTPSASIVRLSGIDARYIGVSTRGLALKSYIEDCSVLGANLNAFDLAMYSEIRACEAAGAGSGTTYNGDGFNWHNDATCFHYDLYTHDNYDDGMSSHENCREFGSGTISEYNGGGGFTPAYGAQAVYDGCLSRKNNGVTGRFNTGKVGGFESHAANAGSGDDISTLTSVEAYNCISIGDRNGFYDYWYKDGSNSHLKAYNCKSIDPIAYGFACGEISDCSHTGTGTAKAPEREGRNVSAKNTTLVA